MKHRLRRVLIVVASSVVIFFVAINTKLGNGRIISETRPIDAFSQVRVLGNATTIFFFCRNKLRVNVSKADQPSITIQADENLTALVSSSVSEGTLTVNVRGFLFPTRDIIVRAKTPKIDSTSDVSAGSCTEIEWDLNSFDKLGKAQGRGQV